VTSEHRLLMLRGELIASLAEYDTPLSAGWLAQHRVTLDEVIDLMDDVRARLEFAEVFIEAHKRGG
jgi:hypothetical protein